MLTLKPQTCSRVETSLKTNRPYLPYAVNGLGFQIPFFIPVTRLSRVQLFYAEEDSKYHTWKKFMLIEEAEKQNIAPITSAYKTYIPSFLVAKNKWCHKIAFDTQ